MKRSAACLLFAWLLLTVVGCTASRGFITLSTVPEGAEVYVDGVSKGFTPLTFDYDLEKGSTLQIEKEGYLPVFEDLNRGWVFSEGHKGNFHKEPDGSGGRIWKVKTTRALRPKY